MPKFGFHKLVRDKITRAQLASGITPTYRIVYGTELQRILLEKLVEEAKEASIASQAKRLGELADVQQVLDDLLITLGHSKQQLAEALAAKNDKAGSFSEGIFVETIDGPEGNDWVALYRQDPLRFPLLQ